MEFPFQQQNIGSKIIRTFFPDTESDEFKWHRDLKDRKVTIIKDGGWQFQMEDSMPNKLSVDEQIFIPKLVWHRVIKGTGELIVEIEE